jgi:hypothetical protein
MRECLLADMVPTLHVFHIHKLEKMSN